LTDRYTGSIDATFSGGTLTVAGATADAALNPAGPFQPAPGTGGSTGVQDNYGIRAEIIPVLLVAIGAARDLTFSVAGGPIPVIGTAFDATQISVTTTGGVMDYSAATLGSGFLPLDGNTGANQVPAGIFSISPGGLATLTIPIAYSQPFDVLDTDGDPNTFDSRLDLTGQLVATAIVPEPSSLLLALSGMGLVCAGWSRRKWRHA
jgi:hypothetical protein